MIPAPMKDLYKRLSLDPSASEEEIRYALPTADASTRIAAQFILLVPRRRTVYDRNHRVLTTIGQLRGRLALGLRPFWSHGHHQDFAQPFVAPQATDPMSVIYAAAGPSKRHRPRWIRWTALSLSIALFITALWIWMHWK